MRPGPLSKIASALTRIAFASEQLVIARASELARIEERAQQIERHLKQAEEALANAHRLFEMVGAHVGQCNHWQMELTKQLNAATQALIDTPDKPKKAEVH